MRNEHMAMCHSRTLGAGQVMRTRAGEGLRSVLRHVSPMIRQLVRLASELPERDGVFSIPQGRAWKEDGIRIPQGKVVTTWLGSRCIIG